MSIDDAIFGTSCDPHYDGHYTDTLEYEDIMDTLDSYRIHHEVINPKGRLCYEKRDIILNPIYNEDVDTLMHEYMHIHMDRMGIETSERDIESMAQEYLNENYGARHCLETYLNIRQG